MFAIGLAAAAYYVGYKLIGAKGWLVLLPLLILLILNPAAGAAAFLILLGLSVVGGICYLIFAFFWQILGFFIGIAFVFLLIIGLGQLIGA